MTLLQPFCNQKVMWKSKSTITLYDSVTPWCSSPWTVTDQEISICQGTKRFSTANNIHTLHLWGTNSYCQFSKACFSIFLLFTLRHHPSCLFPRGFPILSTASAPWWQRLASKTQYIFRYTKWVEWNRKLFTCSVAQIRPIILTVCIELTIVLNFYLVFTLLS